MAIPLKSLRKHNGFIDASQYDFGAYPLLTLPFTNYPYYRRVGHYEKAYHYRVFRPLLQRVVVRGLDEFQR
jgi:hypothetical protein